MRMHEAGEATSEHVDNVPMSARCRAKHGDVEGPWVVVKSVGGVSPLSLVTFFAAAKKVSAAPHRGNAHAA